MRTLLFAICLFFVGTAFPATSEQPPKGASAPTEKQHIEGADPRHSAKTIPSQPAASVAGGIATAAGPINSENSNCCEPKPDKDWVQELRTDPIATFTGLLFFVTVLLWWSTHCLVRGAEDTAKRQLRAYVFVGEAAIIHAGTNMVEAAIKVKNFGQTPAYDVTISTAARAFNIPGDIIAFAPTPVGPDSSRFVFGPGAEGRYSISLHTLIGEPEAMVGLKAGEGALYVYGEIRYRDTFKRQVVAQFRFVIGGSVGWPSDNRMVVCQEGNEEEHT